MCSSRLPSEINVFFRKPLCSDVGPVLEPEDSTSLLWMVDTDVPSQAGEHRLAIIRSRQQCDTSASLFHSHRIKFARTLRVHFALESAQSATCSTSATYSRDRKNPGFLDVLQSVSQPRVGGAVGEGNHGAVQSSCARRCDPKSVSYAG